MVARAVPGKELCVDAGFLGLAATAGRQTTALRKVLMVKLPVQLICGQALPAAAPQALRMRRVLRPNSTGFMTLCRHDHEQLRYLLWLTNMFKDVEEADNTAATMCN